MGCEGRPSIIINKTSENCDQFQFGIIKIQFILFAEMLTKNEIIIISSVVGGLVLIMIIGISMRSGSGEDSQASTSNNTFGKYYPSFYDIGTFGE